MYFVATDPQHGMELWGTDGSSGGTRLVKDIKAGTRGSYPAGLVNIGGTLFFAANGTGGRELWKTDGTSTGTVRVKDIAPAGPSKPSGLTAMGDTLVFAADDGTMAASRGRAMARPRARSCSGTSDPVPRGPSARSGVWRWIVIRGRPWQRPTPVCYWRPMMASTASNRGDSDGTRTGTKLLADVSPNGGSDPTSFAAVSDRLFFAADDLEHGKELWATAP